MKEKIKIRDLMEREVDVDVFNDVTDDISPAFSGILNFTEAGEEKFGKVADIECEVDADEHKCTILINGKENWEELWRNVTNMFSCAAGYCSLEDWMLYFHE